MSDERRRAKRFTVVDLDLYFKESEEKIGRVVNISQGGLLVISDIPLQENLIHTFRIPFSQTVSGQVNFDFNAQVAWSKSNSLDPNKNSVGLQFSDHAEIQTQFIHNMIKLFGK